MNLKGSVNRSFNHVDRNTIQAASLAKGAYRLPAGGAEVVSLDCHRFTGTDAEQGRLLWTVEYHTAGPRGRRQVGRAAVIADK